MREIAQALPRAGQDDAGQGGQDDRRSTPRRWSWSSSKGYSLAFGARFLKRFIDERIKLPISARWKDGSHFEREGVDGESS